MTQQGTRGAPYWRSAVFVFYRGKFMLHHHTIELIRLAEALRNRFNALDATAIGITEGIRQNTLDAESAYQLLDLLSADLKSRGDALLTLLLS
jgi:hypothetical protein